MDTPAAAGTPAYETARIHLQLLGQERLCTVEVPLGPATLRDLLPAARAITEEGTRVAVEQAQAEGRTISCRAGCGACCRQLVAISYVEAKDLAELVASLPPERQAEIRSRFAQALRRLEAAGLLDPKAPRGDRALLGDNKGTRDETVQAVARRYFQQQIPCPFLENESCSIYPRRPMVCREYHVTSPAERCARLYEAEIEPVKMPIRMGSVLARTGREVLGIPVGQIPLVLALEWAEAHGDRLRQSRDGMALFQVLVSQMDPKYDRPFDERP